MKFNETKIALNRLLGYQVQTPLDRKLILGVFDEPKKPKDGKWTAAATPVGSDGDEQLRDYEAIPDFT